MNFSFSLRRKILFYLDYFVRKVFCLWVEVKRPKIRMFVYEMVYSAKKLADYGSMYPSPFPDTLVETKFGRFRVRPHTVDMSNASPAFERRDLEYLLGLVGKLENAGRKILFLDIGADIGTFTVTVGNRFRRSGGLRVMAFEPSPSFQVLKENVAMNSLEDKVEAFNFALGAEDGGTLEFQFNPEAPGSSGRGISSEKMQTLRVPVKTLDAVLHDRISVVDAIVMKMDVEGMETEILKGAGKLLEKDVYLLIEDFVKPEIVAYLEKTGAEFITKLTPYNSFWVFKGGSSV